MRDATQATDAKSLSPAGPRRSRLAIEIAAVLAVKFVLLYVIWAVWFDHPASRHLDARGVAAAVLGVHHAAPKREGNPE